jgi:hypothetical protein
MVVSSLMILSRWCVSDVCTVSCTVEVLFPLVVQIKEVLFKILWEELLVQDPALTINVLCANSHYSFSIPGVFKL